MAESNPVWKLRPGWSANVCGTELLVGSDTRRYRLRSTYELPACLPEILSAGTVSCESSGLRIDVGSALIRKLADVGAMYNTTGSDNLHRTPQDDYFLHIGVDPRVAHSRLKSKTVMVLGLGGTGSIILSHLIGSGIERLVLVDRDEVDASNLERQLIYKPSQVGSAKVDAAASYVRWHMAAPPTITTYKAEIKTSKCLIDIIRQHPELCFGAICIDRPAPRAFHLAAEVFWNAGVACIHGGVLARSGFYGPLLDPLRSLAAPSTHALAANAGSSETVEPLHAALNAYNTIVAASMVAEIIHYLVGATDLVEFNQRTFLDFERRSIFPLPFVQLSAGYDGEANLL